MTDADRDANDDSHDDDIERILRQLFSGQGGIDGLELPEHLRIDPEQFAKAAGLPSDPAMLQALFAQISSAIKSSSEQIDWSVARDRAVDEAKRGSTSPDAATVSAFQNDFQVASLWLSEVTDLAEGADLPRVLSRVEWIFASIDTWSTIAEPVAVSISDALMSAVAENSPDELRDALAGASKMIRGMAGAMFAIQLGSAVGKLSGEVVSGGDIGVPLFEKYTAALLPQNVAAFADGLDQSLDEVRLYLAVREQAHARLFHNARWLRLHLINAIRGYSQGIEIDVERIEALASEFDPSNPEEIRLALSNGSLIPPKTQAQLDAHAKIELLLALIEGWVDVVTLHATKRLPGATAIAEMVRRRRATGGPAESAFATLIGLELRPRLLREAASMWQWLTEHAGAELRDSLWQHPDLLPTSEDVADPEVFLARIRRRLSDERTPEEQAFDDELAALLSDDDAPRPVEGIAGDLLSDPDAQPDGDD